MDLQPSLTLEATWSGLVDVTTSQILAASWDLQIIYLKPPPSNSAPVCLFSLIFS